MDFLFGFYLYINFLNNATNRTHKVEQHLNKRIKLTNIKYNLWKKSLTKLKAEIQFQAKNGINLIIFAGM